MNKLLLTIHFSLLSFLLLAKPADTSKHTEKKFQVRGIPVVSYAPETHLLVGVGGLVTFQMCHQDTVTHHSLVEAFVAYTQNHQEYIYVPYILYTKNNNYYFEGEVDYYNYSYYYWGAGTHRVPQELYNVRFPRISMNAYRKIIPHSYGGIDYYFENDNIWQTTDGGQLQTGEILGSNGSANSGTGIDLLYDTRDSIYFPKKGWFIKATSFLNSTALGSTYNYNKVISDVSWYTSLSQRTVLAVNEHTQLTWEMFPLHKWHW